MRRIGSLSPACCFITSAQAVPTVGCPAKSSSARGVKMRTRHVFAGSFFGRTKVVSPQFAGNLLHALGRNASRLRQNRELIAAERCRTENIDDVKYVLHRINLRASPQALTTRSISTQAPNGSAATAIVVRAGKG